LDFNALFLARLGKSGAEDVNGLHPEIATLRDQFGRVPGRDAAYHVVYRAGDGVETGVNGDVCNATPLGVYPVNLATITKPQKRVNEIRP
jgi:hypothetical protein